MRSCHVSCSPDRLRTQRPEAENGRFESIGKQKMSKRRSSARAAADRGLDAIRRHRDRRQRRNHEGKKARDDESRAVGWSRRTPGSKRDRTSARASDSVRSRARRSAADMATTAKGSLRASHANSRGAVPGPKAKPRMPGNSFEATSATDATGSAPGRRRNPADCSTRSNPRPRSNRDEDDDRAATVTPSILRDKRCQSNSSASTAMTKPPTNHTPSSAASGVTPQPLRMRPSDSAPHTAVPTCHCCPRLFP